jgi:hypothetical protein
MLHLVQRIGIVAIFELPFIVTTNATSSPGVMFGGTTMFNW